MGQAEHEMQNVKGERATNLLQLASHEAERFGFRPKHAKLDPLLSVCRIYRIYSGVVVNCAPNNKVKMRTGESCYYV